MNNIDLTINKLIKKYKKFLISFSGGIDSSVLLYSILKNKKKNKIRVIHINHNLSKNSKKWEKHCVNICKKYKINIIIKNILIKNKNNIENKCREKRYKICIKELLKNEILLTAHHMNDQCETILLALKRGSGLTGLCGIKKKYSINKKTIIRPLINIHKECIKKYAKKNNIKWINDESNKNNKLDRNFIRNIIIPKIINKWPHFIKCSSRSAKICFNQNNFINKIIKKKIKNIIIKKNSLKYKEIIKLNKEEFNLIIRKWIKINNKKMISYKNLNIIWKQIFIKKYKKKFILHFKQFFISKKNNIIYLIKKK